MTARAHLPLALALAVACCCFRLPPAAAANEQSQRQQFRVCADPNNLPFSNRREEGFENALAKMVAQDLNADLTYEWRPQRRGFVRNTLTAAKCDVVMGIPSAYDRVLATNPYYRSTYVFVYRADKGWKLTSLDDPQLRRLRIGVQVVGDDYANTPPAHALGRRGIVENVVGYSLYGDYFQANPPARIIDAVVNGEIDVAIAWGPMAGYFAQLQSTPLSVEPVSPQIDLPFLPFVYDISMGVRRGDNVLRDELNDEIRRRQPQINELLHRFGVPLVGEP